jgi:hypothetical protein
MSDHRSGARVSVLRTAPVTAPITLRSGRFRPKAWTESRAFQDWVVDGVALRQLVAQRSGCPEGAELPSEHPPLRSDDLWPQLAVINLRSLLGEIRGELPDGRVALLYCPECADIRCGALTADFVLHADMVEWRDVGWQVEEDFDVLNDGFATPLTLRFSRAPYAGLLRRLLTEYTELANAAR